MMSPFLKQVHTQVKGGTRMSENQNCGIRDFSKYDEMTTEELEEILRLDAEMIDGQESDTEIPGSYAKITVTLAYGFFISFKFRSAQGNMHPFRMSL